MSSEDLLDHGRRIAELERKVSELYRRLGQAEPASVGADEDPRLLEFIDAGNEIQAIKLYRELTGAGLAESKDAIERIASLRPPTG
jgi:ribosomal protein L7/L12